MCTAIAYQPHDFYFGRTLDYPLSYGEEVVVTPRRYPFAFRHAGTLDTHHALVGMAHIAADYPLYYEAINDCGLGMAGLNFPGNAAYGKPVEGKDNIAVFEFIPWIIGRCATVAEAREALAQLQLVDTPFSDTLPPASLHWIIADRNETIVVEATADGMMLYDNPVGVLTNNPPFSYHLANLVNYRQLSPRSEAATFAPATALPPYCGGMGAIGLPGDCSSPSRFVRAAFLKLNSVCENTEESAVEQFFHILAGVAMTRGSVLVEDGTPDVTLYTACANATRGIYYYTTYENRRIHAVDMHRTPLDGSGLSRYPLHAKTDIAWQN